MTPAQAARLKRRLEAARKTLLSSPRFHSARATFATPQGRELIEQLRAQFDGDELLGDSPEETYFNLGARWLFRELVFLATAGTTTAGERTEP